MDNVIVSLPKPEDTTGLKIKSFLKQLELSIHHLQLSVEQMEKDGELTENTFIMWRFPWLEKQKETNNEYHIHVDSVSDTHKMQDIQLEIATV